MKALFRLLYALVLVAALLPSGGQAQVAQAPKKAGGLVVNAVDNDPANRIWNCETNRVGFGVEASDKSRCFTFRYQVPAAGIQSAILHVVLGPPDSSDALVVGVGKMFPSCSWAVGPMPCVMVMGGPISPAPAHDVDLLNITRAMNVPNNTAEAQEAVLSQLRTGVLHAMFQDDSAVYCAQLVINGGTGEPPCTRASPGKPGSPPPVAAPGGAATPTGDTLPMPPYGTPEPALGVKGMTLQGSQRRVRQNEVVTVPFFLINGANLANMNFEVLYDLDVVRAEGAIAKGNLLDNALLSTNPKVGGLIRAGFAQRSGISGTGTVMNVAFRAVGKPGDSTRLHLVVTTINTPEGTQPTIYRIPGEIAIVDKDGRYPPGGVGPGPGTGGPGTGGPGTGGPGTGPGTGGPGTGGPGTGGPGTGAPGGLTAGDCDGDGRLTALDARCALEMSVQLVPVQLALDMDNSKDVTSRDASLILQRAVGR